MIRELIPFGLSHWSVTILLKSDNIITWKQIILTYKYFFAGLMLVQAKKGLANIYLGPKFRQVWVLKILCQLRVF